MVGAVAALRLGWRRAVRAPGRWLGCAFGVTLALALTGALAASATVAGDHAARRSLAGVSPQGRIVSLSWNGGAAPSVDRRARLTLQRMGAGRVTRSLIMVPTTFGRGVVRLAAVAAAAPALRVVGGRLPAGRCTPARCEVLYAGGSPVRRSLSARAGHLVVVGRGVLADRRALGFTTRRSDLGGRATARRPSLLVAADPGGLDRLPGVASVSRVNTWIAPLDLGSLHAWSLPRAISRVAAQEVAVQRDANGFTAKTPTGALTMALDRSRAAAPRLTAVSATAAAVLAVFLVLAAGGLRGGLIAENRRLSLLGATALQRGAAMAAETAVPVAAGVAAGAAAAVAAGLARASAGGVPGDEALSAVLDRLASRGLPVALACWLLIVLAARLPARSVRALLASALAALAAGLAGVLASAPGGGGDPPLPAATIPLCAGLAAVVVALALPSLLRLLSRLIAHVRPTTGLALVQMARENGAVAPAAAALAVSTGLAIFAVGYHDTLQQSRRDRADHLVPAAAVVSAGPRLEAPLRHLSPAGWRRATGATGVAAVLRTDASALAGPTRRTVTVLGVPARALAGLAAWRSADAAGDRGALAARLNAGAWADPAPGARLPDSPTTVSVALAQTGDGVDVLAVLRDPGGGVEQVRLGRAAGATSLSAAVPARARGGRLQGLVLQRPEAQLVTATHQTAEGGGGSAAATTGTLAVRGIRVGSRRVPISTWTGHGGAAGPPGRVRYALDGSAPAVLRPPTAADAGALPVLADRATAADAAISHGLTVDVRGVEFPARVVGVVRRLPTVPAGRRVLIADTAALASVLQFEQPAAAEPSELWLAPEAGRRVQLADAARRTARRLGLRVRTRDATLARLESEPVAREVLGALTATVLLAVLLALLAAAMAVRGELRDRGGELLDLEAQGIGPAALRRSLRTRSAIVTCLGVLAGLAFGAALTPLLVRAVEAGLGAPRPDPPVVAVLPLPGGVLVALGLLLAAATAGAAATIPAFREPVAPAVTAEAS